MSATTSAADVVRAALREAGVTYAEPREGTFDVELPGEHKLRTPCTLRVGEHTVQVHAFVARRPDEHAHRVHRWLLERNAKLPGIAFAVDRAGDIYLVGRLPLAAVSAASVDAVLGAVLATVESSFDPILELGFASSIRHEWAWRLSRGEPTHNLAAFEHLRPSDDEIDAILAAGPPAAVNGSPTPGTP
jgi:hypothetical protein